MCLMHPVFHVKTAPWLSVLLLTLGTLSAFSARGQPAYPAKNIRVIVPSPTGGPSDIVARLIGDKMAQAFDKQVVIDNRTGASPRPSPTATRCCRPRPIWQSTPST